MTIAAEIRKFVDEFLLGYFRLFNYIHFKMKTLTFLFFGLLLCPMTLLAQSAEVLLQKVADALSAGKDDYAVFYWTSVGKATAAAPRLAQELAVCYRDKRNYDKAYLFYKEWLQYYPEDVSALVACAEMQMMRGETKDAMKLYEKVLALDADNLQANIFLGNYYYLQAEQKKKTLEDNYKKIVAPTRMQYAGYRNGLSDIYSNGYSKAKGYLQKVLQLFPSTEAGKTLERIKKLEKEMNN